MKISFCVTYYNQKEFVQQSLDSIFAIDLPFDYEVLIGDDGSDDGTIEEIKKYQEKHSDKIKLFVMPRESSKKYNFIYRVIANRLNLVSNAKGEYLCFLDGDDCYCDKDFAKDAVQILDNDKTLSGCAFKFQFVYPSKTVPYENKISKGRLKNTTYVKLFYIHSGAFVFRNTLNQEKIKLLEETKNFDDNSLTLYMVQYGDLYYIDRTVYSYKQNENSIWNSATEIEQNLLNAMAYEIMSRVVTIFKVQLLYRQFMAIKEIYKNKTKLKELLGKEKFLKYKTENTQLENSFILGFFDWRSLSYLDKLKQKILYHYLRMVRKFA